jgi:hypothetical protein
MVSSQPVFRELQNALLFKLTHSEIRRHLLSNFSFELLDQITGHDIPNTSGSQVSRAYGRQLCVGGSGRGGLVVSPIWLSKCITLTLPHRSYVDLNADRVVVWSPPSVMILGVVYAVDFVFRPATILK